MTVENGMDRTLGRYAHIRSQPPDQTLANLAGAPIGLLLFDLDNQALQLRGHLVGVAHRPARAIAQRFKPMLLVTIVDFVAGPPDSGARERTQLARRRYRRSAARL